MKQLKAVIARVLTVAVMITSLLPSSVLTVNAATVQTSVEGWKVQKDYTDWSEDFDDFLNLDGIQTWHITSDENDGNIHVDMSAANAPAAVYAKNIDITASNDENDPHRVISFDVLPKSDPEMGEESTAAQMRFGVFLKYVDETHWVFLGNQSTNNWFLQWNDGTIQSDASNYKNLSDVNQAFSFTDDTYHRIIIEYESSSKIKLTLWNMEQDASKNWITSGSPIEKTIGDADFNGTNMLQAIRDYAGVTSQSPKPIYFGFKAGAGSVAGHEGKILTNVDIANVQTNVSKNSSEMQSLRYTYCGWTSPKGKKASDIISVDSDGGINYVSIDASESDMPKTVYYENEETDDLSEGSVSAVFRPYIADEDKQDQAVTTAFYLNARSATSQAPKSVTEQSPSGYVQVGFNGTNWVYKLNGVETVINGAAAPKYMHEYRVDMSFTDGNKFSASVVEVKREGSEDPREDSYEKDDFSTEVEGSDKITIADNVSLDNTGVAKSGNISITAGAGTFLRFRNVNYTKTAYQEATDFLGDDYKEIMSKNNDDHTFYTAAWNAFNTIRTNADADLKANGVMTEQGARNLLATMQSAWNALNVDDNKIEVDKASLETAKGDLEDKAESGYYSYDENAFNAAKDAIDAVLAKIEATPDEVTKSEVTEALEKYNAMVFSEMPAEDDDKAAIDSTVADMTAGIDAADADYYDNWTAYEQALNALEALKTKEGATKKEIADAIDDLEAAINELTLAAATSADREALKGSIETIKSEVASSLQPNEAYNSALQAAEALANGSDPTTKKALAEALSALTAAKNALPKKTTTITPPDDKNTVTVGQVVTSNSMDYKVTSVTGKTVVLTEGKNANQTKVTIPATITIGKDSYKVVGIEANAFKNYKKIKTLTIGANVTSIAKKAFPNCAKLTKLVFKTSNVTLKKNAFAKVKKTVKVTVPKSLKNNKKKKFLKKLKQAGVKKYK